MTLMESDLLAALKELLETSEMMTSRRTFTAEEMGRYKRFAEWANRVIARTEGKTGYNTHKTKERT